MKEDFRFTNELFRIVGGALRLDVEKVRNYSAFLADKLEASGDVSSARRLRKLLEDSDSALRPVAVTFAGPIPVDAESRFPLLDKRVPSGLRDVPLVLAEAQWEVVHEFLSVAKSHSQLESAGLTTSLSCLLYGPPGCGKSRLAQHIADELGMPLYVARLDGLISSYLGTTSKNIRALFEFAARTPCVLFLDEFDAIAKLRGDGQELGELKRVVNSFIQNFDLLGAQSVVLAATNHEELLDRAVWRRFAYRLQLSYPAANERHSMWESFLGSVAISHAQIDLLVDLSEGFSGSDIHEVCLRLRRRHITTKVEPTVQDAFTALRSLASGEGNERRFVGDFALCSSPEVAVRLRARNNKLYSSASVAELLGVAKSTAHRWMTSETVDD